MTDLLAQAIAEVRDRFDLPVGDRAVDYRRDAALERHHSLEGLVPGGSPIVVHPFEGEPDPLMDKRLEAVAHLRVMIRHRRMNRWRGSSLHHNLAPSLKLTWIALQEQRAIMS
jgi:hypothetical protein